MKYVSGLETSAEDLSSSLFDSYVKKEEEKWADIMKMDGDENAKHIGELAGAHPPFVAPLFCHAGHHFLL